MPFSYCFCIPQYKISLNTLLSKVPYNGKLDKKTIFQYFGKNGHPQPSTTMNGNCDSPREVHKNTTLSFFRSSTFPRNHSRRSCHHPRNSVGIKHVIAPACSTLFSSYFLYLSAYFTNRISMGTSINGPTTAANASPELIPNTAMETAMASSKLLPVAVKAIDADFS
jgi:hypothetical protein